MTVQLQHDQWTIEETGTADSQWVDFAENASKCFFCQPSWSGILDAGYGIETRVYLLKQNGQIVLGLPAAKFDFGWFRLLHAYTPYGEFVGEKKYVPAFLKLLEKHAAKSGIHLLRITQMNDGKEFFDTSYRVKNDCFQMIDLAGQTEETLWTGYKKNIRRDVRIGQNAGMVSEELKTLSEIDAYYELYCKTMKRKRAYGPHPRRLYHEIAQKLVPSGQAAFLAAKVKGELAGGIIVISYKDTVYLLGNASDDQYHSLCPNDFLIHAALQYTIKTSRRYFDFMTTGESYLQPSKLSAFKEKWGAIRFPFTVYEKDLDWRCKIWSPLWKFVNTPPGGFLLRFFMNR